MVSIVGAVAGTPYNCTMAVAFLPKATFDIELIVVWRDETLS